ncbi:MAG: TonB-dependent receptor domain-containing protein [Thiobacillaceae bacterium]
MQTTAMAALGGGLLVVATGLTAAPQIDATDTYLDEIVVTASRVRQPLTHSLRHTTVITAADIRASQAVDLPALLRQQAGIEVTQSGGIGAQSSLFLRGANSNQTLVLLDGQRIDSATTGAAALDQIMLADIERIEIVRGNVSALYGASAIGGVIQIFTRKGAGRPGGELRAGLGSYGARTLSGGYGGQIGATRFHLGLAYRDSDGFSAARPEFIPTPFVFAASDLDRDGYRNTTFTFNLAHDLKLGHTLSALGRFSRGRVEYDGTWSNRSEQDLDALQLTSENRLSEQWTSRLMLATSRDALDSFLDTTPAGRVHTRNRQIDWLNTMTIAPDQSLTLGLGWLSQRVASDAAYTSTRREARHAAAGYVGEFGRHGVQMNLRTDDYSDFGNHSTWLASYGLEVAPGWRLLANAGTAFRAPTFNDLYNPAWGGNPNLRPEKARSWEAGVQYASGPWLARLVHFDTRTRDLIVYQWPAGNVNLNRAEVDGWELSASGRLADIQVGLSLTAQDPRDADSGQLLLRRARRLGSLTLRHENGPWLVAAEVKASGSREDIHATNFSRIRLPGYTVFNVSGRYRLRDDLALAARIDNLFDRDYSLVHGYNTAGRSGHLQLEWHF